ncbi:trypsin-like peptidase domain-containing protein [Novipirellula herctigrandis]
MQSVVKLHYTPLHVFGGCGVLVDSRHVLTAKHAVDSWPIEMVSIAIGGEFFAAESIAKHPVKGVDLALIRLRRTVSDSIDCQRVSLCRSKPKAGDRVWLGGYGLSGWVGHALLGGNFASGHNRIEQVTNHRGKIRFDAPEAENTEGDEVFPALLDSGSPVFIRRGDSWLLVGITTTVSNRLSPSLGNHSHHELLAESRKWLDENLPDLKWHE